MYLQIKKILHISIFLGPTFNHVNIMSLVLLVQINNTTIIQVKPI